MAPTGGVRVPTHRFMTIIRPKWTGCIPKAWTIGRKMGVKISTAGVGSMKVPTMSSTIFIIMSSTMGLELMPSMAEEIIWGILAKDMTQLMMEETHTRNSMTAVVLTLDRRMPGRSLILMFR